MVEKMSHSFSSKPAGLITGSPLLAAAFALSIALHGIFLSIHYTLPDPPPQRNRDRGLEVVLVNARHAKAPDKAEVLAQANLDNGGTSEKDVRAKTPLPPQNNKRDGTALAQAQRKVQALEQQQQQLLTQAKKTAPAVTNTPRQNDQPTPTPPAVSGLDLLDSTAAAARLEAEISRNTQEYAKRPRKKNIGARAKEYRFAQYVEDWRQKIERVGTLNYPAAARGKLYGNLLLTVTIRSDGSVDQITIDRSSGHKVLDDAAVRIIKLASPFAPFPPNIKADTDLLEITRTWTFTNTDQVHTQ